MFHQVSRAMRRVRATARGTVVNPQGKVRATKETRDRGNPKRFRVRAARFQDKGKETSNRIPAILRSTAVRAIKVMLRAKDHRARLPDRAVSPQPKVTKEVRGKDKEILAEIKAVGRATVAETRDRIRRTEAA